MWCPLPVISLFHFAFVALHFLQHVSARFPASVDQALQEYRGRRDDLLGVYVHLANTEPLPFGKCNVKGQCFLNGRHPFGTFKEDGTARSFRRMAAWLIAHKKHYLNLGDYGNTIPKPDALGSAPRLVSNWTETIFKFARTGTDTNGGPADYDMVMKEMVTLLYLFKNEPALLNNDAAFRIINQGLVYRGNDWLSHMRFKISILWWDNTYPETENHVLMTLSSIYLTNQWIYNNPRNDVRLTKGTYKNRDYFKNSKSLEDKLLQAMGRIVHSDYFETNARPYQSFSLHSLFNLYAFADSPAIRAAAKNAIDFTATKFAFQSFEGKRLTPQRRQSSHRESMSIYDNDATVFMMSMLSGYYAWNDTVSLDPAGKVDRKNYFVADFSGNGLGHMLWATLFQDENLLGERRYTLPRAVHAFMLRKKKAFWARMQARFTERNYAKSHHPRYFLDHSTQIFRSGKFEFAPELYYGTSSSLNVAGGRFNDYPLDAPFDSYLYDFTGKPSFIMPQGFVQNWGEGITKMAKDTLITTTGPGSAANNLGTYKGFTWGYQVVGKPANDSILQEPFTVPNSWTPSLDYHPGRNGANIRFRFYDLTQTLPDGERTGYYVVTGGLRIIKAPKRKEYLARGFWEIVPPHRFHNLTALTTRVLANNRDSGHFSPSASILGYKSTTSETIELYQDAGLTNVGGIAGIVAPDGKRLNLKDSHIDTAEGGVRMPLIDVTELGDDGLATGMKYVSSSGNGLVQIINPFEKGEGGRLCIDSSDYRNPAQHYDCVGPGS